MARPLILSLDGEEYQVSLVKIDRDKLYGRIEIEAFDDKGRDASLRVLAADGKTLINKGGTSLATVNDKGDSVERSELVPVDADGETIEQVPSSFGQKNVLKPAEVADYLTTVVKSVYLVLPFELNDINPLKDQLTATNMYSFPFSWRGGVEFDQGYLIGSGSEAYLVVGKPAEFTYIKLNQAAVLESTEEEEISADDLDFDLM